MPQLDRLVTLAYERPGRFERGRYVSGGVVTLRLWAALLTGVIERTVNAEGARLDGAATWRIRYRTDVAGADPTLGDGIIVTGPDGRRWRVTTAGESSGRRFQRVDQLDMPRRRRWLDLQAVEVSA